MSRTFKNETALVTAMKKALKAELGGRWIKIHGGPYQEKGVSDILGCFNGRFVAIEVKMPGKEKKLTDLQERFLKQVEKAGGIAFMSTDIDEAIEKLKEVEKQCQKRKRTASRKRK